MPGPISVTESTSTARGYLVSPSTSAAGDLQKSLPAEDFQKSLLKAKAVKAERSAYEKKIEAAVYAYLQAVRALGRTRLNTQDIAEALSLSVIDVDAAISRLGSKGIKLI